MRVAPALLLLLALVPASAERRETPAQRMRHGVVFFCPATADAAVRDLEAIRKDGFDLVKFASWAWTLPKPGSDLETRARVVLDWCDRTNTAFFLLHNIQYGSQGEGGGLDQQVLHPEQTLPLLKDWIRVLRGHRSVEGVILGNEVGPSLGTPEAAPLLWGEFRRWLAARHGTIERLNAAWGSQYASFEAVGVPPAESPGWVDCRSYARIRFARFYGTLIEKGVRPALGKGLYGSKTSLDPFLHRECREMTMVCWDDVLAQHPLWETKCAADTAVKPLFNAELHLYHDQYAYGPSPEQSRYRYLTSSLLGEYLTASFAWGQWQKPEVQRIHAATPKILSDLKRLESDLRLFPRAGRAADLAVLVTEDAYYRPRIDGEAAHPLALLYAHLNALGRPWRYLLAPDLGTFTRGTLVLPAGGLDEETARLLLSRPKGVRLVAVDAVPQTDKYGRPLPAGLAKALRVRLECIPLASLAGKLGPVPGLPQEYRRVGSVPYLWWSEKRGHFHYQVPYCLLEARRVEGPQGTLVALTNNTPDVRRAPVPWAGKRAVVDALTGERLPASDVTQLTIPALAVRVLSIGR